MLISSTSNGSGTNGMAPSLLAENSKKRKKMKHSIIHLTKPNRDPASYRSQKIQLNFYNFFQCLSDLQRLLKLSHCIAHNKELKKCCEKLEKNKTQHQRRQGMQLNERHPGVDPHHTHMHTQGQHQKGTPGTISSQENFTFSIEIQFTIIVCLHQNSPPKS